MSLVRSNPFERGDWHGKIWSIDNNISLSDFTIDDLDKIIIQGETGAGWDGYCAGIALLKDGRYVSWESSWGPTGHGFGADAYGGEAEIYVASTLLEAMKFGLTPSSRDLCWNSKDNPKGEDLEKVYILCKLSDDKGL